MITTRLKYTISLFIGAALVTGCGASTDATNTENELEKVTVTPSSVKVWSAEDGSFFPTDRSLTHAEDGVVLPDGTLLVGDWDHGLVTLDADGTKRPFGDFAAAGFKTRPEPNWGSPNGVSYEPDMRHVLVADITTGAIYRADTHTQNVERIYDHPYGVNAVVRDSAGGIWFTQSTENPEGEESEARMFAAVNGMADGAVYWISPAEASQADPTAKRVLDGLNFANGMALDDKRGRLYVAEIVDHRIHSYAFNSSDGSLTDHKVLAELMSPDNLEMDDQGQLWAASPFGNKIVVIDPDTGDTTTVFEPTPDVSATVAENVLRRQSEGEPILPLFTPNVWGDMPGPMTGIILSPKGGPVYVSGLGNALVRLDP